MSVPLVLLAAAGIGEKRKSQSCCSRLFQLAPDAVSISAGVHGPILDVNACWQNLFGYRRSEAIGHTPRQLGLYANERECAGLAERSRDAGGIRELELEMRNKDGDPLTLLLSGEEIDCGNETRFIAFLRDVTAQRKAEDELRLLREQVIRLTRATLLGQLSGALAHELRQPLAAILANARAARRLIGRQPADLRELGEILDDIADEDRRADEIIRRLRALFMKGEVEMQPLEINELVRDTLELARAGLAESDVTVAPELGADAGVVQGDRVQLQQVLLNLLVNAAESMRGRPPGHRSLQLGTGAEPDGGVRITVADSGPGIAPDVIDQVFDAFFTTKTYGTGVGLSLSRAIVAAHGGRIEATNHPDGGATFRITLPAWAGG